MTKPNPTNNSSIREKIINILRWSPNFATDKNPMATEELRVKELETLITTHTDQILADLDSELPEPTMAVGAETVSAERIRGFIAGKEEAINQVKETIKLYRGKSNE